MIGTALQILSKHMNANEENLIESTSIRSFLPDLKDVLFLLVLVIISLLNSGIGIGIRTHSLQIPDVLRLLDPQLYSRGYFGLALDRYDSVFWRIIAFGTKYWSLTGSLITAQIISRVVLLSGFYCMGFSIYRNRTIARISAILVAFGLQSIWFTKVAYADSLPTHSSLVLSIVPWAFLLFWQRHMIACAIVLGIISHLNLMYAVLLITVFFITIILNWKRYESRSLLLAFVIWFIISLPVLLWALKAPPPNIPLDKYLAKIAGQFSYHFSPLKTNPTVWKSLSGFWLVVILCLYNAKNTSLKPQIFATTLAIVCTWMIGAFLSIVPIMSLRKLILFQWCRTNSFLVAITVPLLAYTAFNILSDRRRIFPAILQIGILIAGWYWGHGYQAAIIVMMIVSLGFYKRFAVSKPDSSNNTIQYKVMRFGVTLLFLLVLALNLWVFAQNVSRRGFKIQRLERDLIEVQYWARDNSNKDALFLIPPRMRGFRVYSQRSVYFGSSDRSVIIYSPDFTKEVLHRTKRLIEIGFGMPGFDKVSWSGVKKLCRDEQIDYIVLPDDINIPLPKLFVNEDWKIYDASEWNRTDIKEPVQE